MMPFFWLSSVMTLSARSRATNTGSGMGTSWPPSIAGLRRPATRRCACGAGLTAPHWGPYTGAMPQTRRGVFPVLLPLIVIVPVAIALSALLVTALQARGARDEASQRARDELRLAARDFEAAARARQAAAELLSRSPALRAWAGGAEVPGEETRGDLATVAGLFSGKAAVSAARAADSAVVSDGIATAQEPGALRAAAAIRQGDATVGEVVLESSADDLAGEVPRATAGNAVVAITDGVGTLLHLSGAAVAGARTISDIFPRIERRIFISAMEASPAADGIRLFDDRVGGAPVVIAAARLPVGDWRLFVAVPVEGALRPSLRGGPPAAGHGRGADPSPRGTRPRGRGCARRTSRVDRLRSRAHAPGVLGGAGSRAMEAEGGAGRSRGMRAPRPRGA